MNKTTITKKGQVVIPAENKKAARHTCWAKIPCRGSGGRDTPGSHTSPLYKTSQRMAENKKGNFRAIGGCPQPRPKKMKRDSFVFDTFALLTFLKGEGGSTGVKGCLQKVQDKKIAGYISAVNLSELYYLTTREKGYEAAEIMVASLKDWGLEITAADEELAQKSRAN